MHELSLALEIRDICERELLKQPETRLAAVGVDVGAFAGVEVDNLAFCLDAVLGERHPGIRCEIRTVPGVARCVSCATEFAVSQAPFRCEVCGATARGASGGDDLQVSYLEVEDEH